MIDSAEAVDAREGAGEDEADDEVDDEPDDEVGTAGEAAAAETSGSAG